ncbi:SRPBCC domain-containing protein [Paenibacillus sp. 5J-6]|uniref:SRPBCC domain-containing protein n=1 Tax=Paenibacillus silvestris TaxID=2606219 RepID=A0A6L8V3C4_9BACL|nr:SRPBCC domain-containing protein [Paenibacillus silvestris]MZQ84046.1 SRPBCC domain-containing protein [Paenibacillus silvestris]
MSNQANTLSDIVQTVVFNAPIQKVWDAVATSEGIAAWFMPNNFKPEAGYEFHLEAGPFGNSPCKVTDVTPPNRLSFVWGKDWSLTFELKDVDGKTEFTLIHAGWDVDKVTEFGQPHSVVREMMANGWTGIAMRLTAYVEA